MWHVREGRNNQTDLGDGHLSLHMWAGTGAVLLSVVPWMHWLPAKGGRGRKRLRWENIRGVTIQDHSLFFHRQKYQKQTLFLLRSTSKIKGNKRYYNINNIKWKKNYWNLSKTSIVTIYEQKIWNRRNKKYLRMILMKKMKIKKEIKKFDNL